MQIRFPLCVLVATAAAVTVLAQQPDADAAKLKEQRRTALTARVASDADQLKLPENRALIHARLGVIAWRNDAEHGKKLFQTAVGELNAAQQEAESAKGRSHLYQDLLNSQNLRPQILNIIAGVDPEFALESLYRTRPANVARAMAGEASEKINDQVANRAYLVQAEMNLEQRLIRMAADKNPEKAAAMLKDTIRKRLSNETYESLKKLYLLDASAGTELADDVLSRLNSASFLKDNQPVWDLLQLSTSMITDHIRERGPDEKYLAFNDARIRTLSVKLLGSYTDNAARIGYVPFEQLEPIAKRYSPGMIEKLRKAAESPGSGWVGHRRRPSNPEYESFVKTNPSAEQMVQNAGRFSPDVQRQLFQNAANKFTESGQYQNAMALLNDKFDGDALDNAVSSLNWHYANHLMQKGEFDAAEALMLEFNESNRVSGLISLAQNVYNGDPAANKGTSINLLRRVRGLISDQPENYNETSQLFSLINAMAAIEPAEAFANLEPLIDPFNTLIQAFAVVQGYQGGQLRQGEYQLANGNNFGIYIDQGMFRNLAVADFDRTNALIDSLARPELRISLRMYLAEGL